jgi:predicted ATP-grasp superfamily ATP-dependent carboligase
MGAPIYAVHDDPKMPAAGSRYIDELFRWDLDNAPLDESVAFLLGLADRIGDRPILITTDDASDAVVSAGAGPLRERFEFPDQPPGLSERLFSKRGLHELCLEHGVPSPDCAFPQNRDEAAEAIAAARYPLLIKPIDNVRFQRRNGTKMVIVGNAAEALIAYDRLEDPADPNIMLQDHLPGGSDSVWVFTGYFNADSELLFGAGGIKARQFPIHTGTTCFGVLESNPEMEAVTCRFVKSLGYRGVFDCGYRYDPRDGRYKMLDVNPRVGSNFRQCVGVDGLDAVRAMYLDLCGEPVPSEAPAEGRVWWVENYDLRAAFGLRREGSLTLRHWLASVRGVDEAAWFARDDLLPFLRVWTRTAVAAARKALRLGRRKLGAGEEADDLGRRRAAFRVDDEVNPKAGAARW